jgi:hypothetical protein
MARITVGNRHAGERLVGDMVDRWPIGRREGSGMAGRALIGYHCLGMVPTGWFPRSGAVARGAICAGRYVRAGLTRSGRSVVATSAYRGAGEATVVHSSGG